MRVSSTFWRRRGLNAGRRRTDPPWTTVRGGRGGRPDLATPTAPTFIRPRTPGQALEHRPGRASSHHVVSGHPPHLCQPVCLGRWGYRTAVQDHGARQHHHGGNLQPPTSRPVRRKSVRCGDGGSFQTSRGRGIPSRPFQPKWAHHGNEARSQRSRTTSLTYRDTTPPAGLAQW